MTWHDQPDGYRVFFNRDERNERKPGLTPKIRQHGDTRLIAPLDGNFGGTWIAVNEHGLTVCLLNAFPATPDADSDSLRHYTSRGHLTLTSAACPSSGHVVDALQEIDADRFQPFVLVAIEPGGGALIHWTGRSLELTRSRPSRQPLVSSSFCTEEVRRNRVAVFGRLLGDASAIDAVEQHLAFHASHDPVAGPHSPCMHRPDASTVSFSHVHVDSEKVRFHYRSSSPCKASSEAPPVFLERRAAVQ